MLDFLAGGFGIRSSAATMHALQKSQAVIEFSPKGRILRANGNFLTAMGYQAKEVIGQHHSMFVGKDYAESSEYRGFWATLAQGTFKRAEFQRFRKDGSEISLQASYNPVFGLGGRVVKIVKLATDVTQEKLKAAEHESQVIAIGRSQAVIQFSLDGTILEANENFLNTMGYRADEIVGKHHSIFVDPSEKSTAQYKQF